MKLHGIKQLCIKISNEEEGRQHVEQHKAQTWTRNENEEKRRA